MTSYLENYKARVFRHVYILFWVLCTTWSTLGQFDTPGLETTQLNPCALADA